MKVSGAAAALATVALAGCGGSAGSGAPAAVTEPPGAAHEQPARASAVKSLGLRRVGNFDQPVYVTAPPKDRHCLFVVEQGGTIQVLDRGRRHLFLDLTDRVLAGGEQGLLSMAFAPNYRRSHRFWVYFTDHDGDIRIQTFKGRGNRARKSSGRNVLKVEHSQASNHNGGQLQFGPDGLLYAGTGDGGGADDPWENGQDTSTRLAKLLRIKPRGGSFRIPRTNPFRDRPGGRTVYSYGLRNPWRFSFDRKTGDLIIGDVGQGAIEEVDFVRRGEGRGANFGWDVWEGTLRHEDGVAPGHVKPVIQLTHDDGFCSVIGGYVLRGALYGALRGMYVYSDNCEGTLRGARLGPGEARERRSFGSVSAPSSFGEDARGRVYVASLGGAVYRLVPR